MEFDVTELKAKAKKALAEASALAAPYKGKEMPADVADSINALVGKSDEYTAQIKLYEKLNSGIDHDDPIMNEAALSWRQAATESEGVVAYDSKSWRSVDVHGQTIRYCVPLAAEKKEYAHAFEAYLRKGYASMGSKDRKSITEGVDNSGGFFVPDDFILEIIKKTATMAKVRSLAKVRSTGRDLVKMPRVNYTTDDKYTSGVRITWTGETPSSSTAHRVTDPVSGEINIPINTAMASILVSLNQLEDSAFDTLSYVSDFMSEAYALGEEDSFINGNGVNRPMGILGQTSITAETPGIVLSGTNAVLTTSGDAHEGARLNDVYYGLPSQYRSNAVWLSDSPTLNLADDLVDAQDRPILRDLATSSMALAEPVTLKGRPYYVSEFMPTPATDSFSLLFGDFKSYEIFDRVGLSIKRFDELYSETNFVLMLARKRLGAYLTKPFAMRVLKLGTS